MCHVIFDVEMDFSQKTQFVAGGHMTVTPTSITYSSVVSRDSVQISFLIAVLNDLDMQHWKSLPVCSMLNPHHGTAYWQGFRASRTHTPTRLASLTPSCWHSQWQGPISNAMVVCMQANRLSSLLAWSYIVHPFAPQQIKLTTSSPVAGYTHCLQNATTQQHGGCGFPQKLVKIRGLPNYHTLNSLQQCLFRNARP
jgi:hypothetical protein